MANPVLAPASQSMWIKKMIGLGWAEGGGMKVILKWWENVLDLYHCGGYIHFCQNIEMYTWSEHILFLNNLD